MSADNSLKTPIGFSVNQQSVRKVEAHLQLTGKDLPASIVSMDPTNTIATIKFEVDGSTYTLPQITIPLHTSEYDRSPLQPGATGMVSGGGASLGQMSGLGANTAALVGRPLNLASLRFIPLGNQNYSKVDDPKAHQTYGPNGTIARDQNKKSQVKTHPTEGATIQGGGDGQGNYPHSSTAGPDKVVHTSTNGIDSNSPLHTVSQDQHVANNHSVGSNITAGNNISAGSSMSAPSGSFGSGSIGGLAMIGGIISGLGGGGGVTGASLAAGASSDNIGPLTDDAGGSTLPMIVIVALQQLIAQTTSYPDDTTAAANGVPIGGIYRNQTSAGVNVVQVRFS